MNSSKSKEIIQSHERLIISLDSNVFRDQDFIDWLELNSDVLSIKISIIASLEIFHWYNLRKISEEIFNKQIQALNAQIIPLLPNEIFIISNNATISRLPFKHHARDYIIGTHAHLSDSILITLNLKHFNWLENEKVMTPDEFVIFMENKGKIRNPVK